MKGGSSSLSWNGAITSAMHDCGEVVIDISLDRCVMMDMTVDLQTLRLVANEVLCKGRSLNAQEWVVEGKEHDKRLTVFIR